MDKAEYEYRFKDYDKKEIVKLIKKHGGKLKYPKRLLRISVYHHPNNKKNFYIRVRDEGSYITLTVKKKFKTKQFEDEYEITVDNYEEANNILKLLGCKLKYYVEKFRETWGLSGCKEIVFDQYPAAPEYMEVECNTKAKLDTTIKKLGFTQEDRWNGGLGDLYSELYGIPKNNRKKGDLSFMQAKKNLYSYVKKNKKLFNDTLKQQKDLL